MTEAASTQDAVPGIQKQGQRLLSALYAALQAVKLYPLEPSNSPTMSTGHKVGKHRILGISDEFIPPIVDLAKLDRVIAVDDGDSIIMAQKLAAEIGVAVGISSGANLPGRPDDPDRARPGRRRGHSPVRRQ